MNKIILLACALCIVALSAQELHHEEDYSIEPVPQLGAYIFGGGIRKNINGKDVSPSFCGYDGSSCHWTDYLESILLLLIPGCVIGILAFIILILFAIIRRCCCVKSSTTYGVREVVILKIVIILTIVLITAALIVAFVGNTKAHNGVNGFASDVYGFAVEIQTLAGNVTVQLQNITEFSGVDFGGTVSAVNQLVDTTQSVKSMFQQYEGYRYDVFIAAYVVLLVMCVVALVSCFIWLCCSGHVNFCLGLIMILFMWLVFSLGISFGSAGTDVCRVLDAQVQESKMNKSSDIFNLFLGQWGVNCSAFAELELSAISTFNNYSGEFCSQYANICNQAGVNGTCQPCVSDGSFNNIVALTRVYNYVQCPDPRCPTCAYGVCTPNNFTIVECATQCDTDDQKNQCASAIQLANVHDVVQGVIKLMTPYLGCNLISIFIERVYGSVCEQFIGGMELMTVASCINGILLIAFSVAVLLSIQKFDPDRLFEEGDDDEEAYNPSVSKSASNSSQKKSNFMGTIGFVPSNAFVIKKGEEEPAEGSENESAAHKAISRVGSVANFKIERAKTVGHSSSAYEFQETQGRDNKEDEVPKDPHYG